MQVSISSSGKGFDNSRKFLENSIKKLTSADIGEKIGDLGVNALREATPKGVTGETANGWKAEYKGKGSNFEINFVNTAHSGESINIAKAIELGHGTGTGGYVPPRPYIKQAMAPVWAKCSDMIRRELSR